MVMMTIVEQVPDPIKLSAAAITPVLSFAGFPIEQWVFVLSAILTCLFIVEKVPKALESIKSMYQYLFKRKKNVKMD